MLEVIYLILVSIVSFLIAANNSAGSVGIIYGSRITPYYTASFMGGLFVMLGTLLEGWKMVGALKGGIIENSLMLYPSLLVLLSTLILLVVFTMGGIPLSASQILLGSTLGVAAYFTLRINYTFVAWVVGAWVLNFILSLLLAILIYYLLIVIARKRRLFILSKFYTISLLVSSAFIAYTLGANTIGLIASLNLSNYSILTAGASAFLGTVLWGRKTVITVGRKITALDPARAFSAQISGSIVVEAFTQLHFPVSIMQAIIGGVIGTGILRGKNELNKKTLKNLSVSWAMVPAISFALTYITAIFLQL